MSRPFLSIALVMVAALAACTTTTATGDSLACAQTYEFGNTGCVEIRGRVAGLRDQPLARVNVATHGFSGPFEQFAASMTDTTGAFTLRVTRMAGSPPRVGPDTLSLWVVAVDVRGTGARDSVLVPATFSPVGSIPTPTTAVIRLAVP